MGTPRLTGFLIGVLLVGFFVAILGIFIANIATVYNPQGYDNTTFEVYDQMQTMEKQIREVKSNVTAIKADQIGILKGIDFIGGIFASAISSVKLTYTSLELTTEMVTSAETELSKTQLALAIAPLKLLVGTLIVIIIIMITLALLLSREKL